MVLCGLVVEVREEEETKSIQDVAVLPSQCLGYFFIFLSFLGTFFLFKTIQNASTLWELLISYFHPSLYCTIASPQIHFRWDQVDFLIPTHETNPAPARSQITQGRCHIFRLWTVLCSSRGCRVWTHAAASSGWTCLDLVSLNVFSCERSISMCSSRFALCTYT